MSDPIERQDAIDVIMNYPHGDVWNVENMDNMVYEIKALPSVQPDIIRCKDCKHKGTKNCVANAWTTILGVTVKDDFYCGLAEKENR